MKPEYGMPLLSEYVTRVGSNHFSGTRILYINHVIDDAVRAAQALKAAGADMHILGIPYGSNDSDERAQVIREYEELGPTIVPKIDDSLHFRREMRAAVQEALRGLSDASTPLMVVEDGGYAFPTLHEAQHTGLLEQTIGAVEHTSRGMWNYQYNEVDDVPRTERKLSKPAITIANSRLKSAHEPTFVAMAVVHELVDVLKRRHEFISFQAVTVLGYGKIGKPIADLLAKMDARITVVDPSPEKAGKPEVKQKMDSRIFSSTRYFVGASGTPALTTEEALSLLKEDKNSMAKFFISASSKNIEFEGVIIALWQVPRS